MHTHPTVHTNPTAIQRRVQAFRYLEIASIERRRFIIGTSFRVTMRRAAKIKTPQQNPGIKIAAVPRSLAARWNAGAEAGTCTQ